MARRTMRVKPAALVGVGLWVLYLVIIVTIQATSGIPYTDWGDSASSLWRGASVSILVGGGVIAAVAIAIGWFGAAMTDTRRSPDRWTLIAPALYLIVVVGNLAFTDWSRVPVLFVLSAATMTLPSPSTAIACGRSCRCFGPSRSAGQSALAGTVAPTISAENAAR